MATSDWNWMYDTDFITYQELVERLRKDLNDPDFGAFDLAVPHNEEEYQQVLLIMQHVMTEYAKKHQTD